MFASYPSVKDASRPDRGDGRTLKVTSAIVCVGVAILIAIFCLLQHTLLAVSAQANELDDRKTSAAVQAAVDSARGSLTGQVRTNSVWDDASIHMYGAQLDKAWMYGSVGALAQRDGDYDGVYVVDDQGAIVWGYAQGEAERVKSIDTFGSGFTAAFSHYKALPISDADPSTTLSLTQRGVAVVGVGVIRPTDLQAWAPSRKRYLVMTRHLTPAFLAQYAKAFGVRDLRLFPPAAASTKPVVALRDAGGAPIGTLVWSRDLPGKAAAVGAWPQIQLSMVLITLMAAGAVGIIALALRRLRLSERETRRQALTDSLSGLPNRRAMMEYFQSVEKDGRLSVKVALVLIDLDGFKDINDTYGHHTGDALILTIAERGRRLLAENCLLVRMGGDEFAMIATGRDADVVADNFCKALLSELAAPVAIGERTVQVGGSIGLAVTQRGLIGGAELLRRADTAMYAAKARGKGKIVLFSEEIEKHRLWEQEVEDDIRAGLARGEFDVHYQPIIDSATGDLASAEALLRWPRRPKGALGPDQFIPIAESSGLIHQLGLFALRAACLDFLPLSSIQLSVNISPAQFRDPAFESHVAEVLRETGFPAARLELELTEGYLIDHPERAAKAIATLKDMGIAVALDDFGTGYTSIAYLRNYGFNRIKIDKSLVDRIVDDEQARVLISGAVFLANGLNMSTTAEGVESEEQATLLRLAGCRALQGYCYGRAVSFKNFNEVLAARLQSAA